MLKKIDERLWRGYVIYSFRGEPNEEDFISQGVSFLKHIDVPIPKAVSAVYPGGYYNSVKHGVTDNQILEALHALTRRIKEIAPKGCDFKVNLYARRGTYQFGLFPK